MVADGATFDEGCDQPCAPLWHERFSCQARCSSVRASYELRLFRVPETGHSMGTVDYGPDRHDCGLLRPHNLSPHATANPHRSRAGLTGYVERKWQIPRSSSRETLREFRRPHPEWKPA